jgi:hypothetical protein
MLNEHGPVDRIGVHLVEQQLHRLEPIPSSVAVGIDYSHGDVPPGR